MFDLLNERLNATGPAGVPSPPYVYTPNAPNAESGAYDTAARGYFSTSGQPMADLSSTWTDYGQGPAQYLDPKALAAMGYSGPMVPEMNGDGGGSGLAPQLKAFLDAKYGDGWTVGGDYGTGYGPANAQVFSKQGGGYAKTDLGYKSNNQSGNDFWSNFGSVITAALGGAAAGGAMGAGSTAAGEGAGALSGMDLAADAGMAGGNGLGSAGSALGGAGGVPQAFGAAGASGGGSPMAAQAGMDMASMYPAPASGFSVPPADASLFGGGMLDSMPASTNYLDSYLGGLGGAEGSLAGSGVAAGGAPLSGGLMTGAGGLPGGVGGPIPNALAGIKALIGGGGFSGGNLTSLIGNGLGALLTNNAIGKAADAQRAGLADSNALLKQMYDQTRADNMPALGARNNGLAGYQALLKDPSSVANDPGYAWARDEGQLARDRTAAARGMLMSGPQIKGAIQYGNDYATTKFDNALNRHGNLAGLGSVGAGTVANAGQNYGNNVSQNALSQGNVNGSAYVGGANNWNNAIGNTLNNWQQNDLLKRLGIGGP